MVEEQFSLFEKYRPKTIDDMVGDYQYIKGLTKHSYLLQGSSGSGKTTVGKAMANQFGALPNDIVYLNIADRNSVDDARYLLDKILYSPEGKAWVLILDECHKASSAFFDAILIPLENPPKNVYWILCTSMAQKVPDTVSSRCSKINMIPLNNDQMFDLLKDITTKENLPIPNGILSTIAESSKGNARTAISAIDTIIPMDNESRLAYVNNLGEESAEVIEIARYFWGRERDWPKFYNMLKPYKGTNFLETIRITVLSYGVSMLAKGTNVSIIKKCNYLLDTTFKNGYSDLVIMLAKSWEV